MKVINFISGEHSFARPVSNLNSEAYLLDPKLNLLEQRLKRLFPKLWIRGNGILTSKYQSKYELLEQKSEKFRHWKVELRIKYSAIKTYEACLQQFERLMKYKNIRVLEEGIQSISIKRPELIEFLASKIDRDLEDMSEQAPSMEMFLPGYGESLVEKQAWSVQSVLDFFYFREMLERLKERYPWLEQDVKQAVEIKKQLEAVVSKEEKCEQQLKTCKSQLEKYQSRILDSIRNTISPNEEGPMAGENTSGVHGL